MNVEREHEIVTTDKTSEIMELVNCLSVRLNLCSLTSIFKEATSNTCHKS